MIPSDDCDDCRPAYLQRRLDSYPASTLLFSSVPFIFTFLVVAVLVSQKVLPLLGSSGTSPKSQELPTFNESALQPPRYGTRLWRRFGAQRIAAATCAISIALSSVLVELILCEMSNSLNPAARSLALRVTLSSLLLLIIVITPAIEIHSIISSWVRSADKITRAFLEKPSVRYPVKIVAFAVWLFAFWILPRAPLLPASLRGQDQRPSESDDFIEACLERIGIIGISLMASLAGFAAVSSIWQTFGVKHRLVRESDILRKEAGLNASQDMLAVKQSQLRALQRKISEAAPDPGFLKRLVGSMRSTTDMHEARIVAIEIQGLETMSSTLATSAAALRSVYQTQQQAHTLTGRFTRATGFTFTLYCLYRIGATSLSSLRRWWQPSSTFATSDPISNILALLTAHYDGSLDRAAWARQISFALSGVMLLLSFSAVLQTFRLFSRFAPRAVQHAQTSLPLIISQIAGTYVISSALLLRSNLPPEMSSVITDALGSPLDSRFVEGWFESWFLVAVGLTATGILVSRKVGSGDWDDWDDAGDLETGKRS